MSNIPRESIRDFYKLCEKFKVSCDLIDINALYDLKLTCDENLGEGTEIYNIIKNMSHNKETEINIKQEENLIKINNMEQQNEENILNKEVLNKVRCIAIYGDIGTGKTALAYRIIQEFKGTNVYFIKYPQKKLLNKMGYKNLVSLEELERLQDCVVYWDEPQLTTSIYDKKSNSIIAKVCSIARQRNILIIISSSDSRVFTKHNEAYFDLWLIKDIDYSMVKQGSKIRKAIRDNCILDACGFRLNINEFISESRKLRDYNGKHEFKLVDFWNEELSCPYRMKKKNEF